MKNAEKVKQEAIESGKILGNLFKKFPATEREFKSSFHLRPTSSGDTTIVSTLPFAPMRGISKVKINKLENKLNEIINILFESNDIKKHKMMEKLGFKDRGGEAQREENAQAALIRDLILRPVEYNHLQFVASEFELFEYREKTGEIYRSDVLAFKDGILYDIELKNKRETKTVKQANDYVTHIRDNLGIYSDCLYEFPNCRIDKIKDVKGVALVPYAENHPPVLENEGKKAGVELWYFNINKNHVIYNFIRK